jgi:Holliday junction resolvase RusA-like endonuclease
LPIKPLSLNHAYRGRRFETPELQAYKQELAYLLPRLTIPKGKLKVRYRFGVSSKNCDGDNLVKCLQDALAARYGFNDKQIYAWAFEKVDVAKGKEFVGFEISSLQPSGKPA